MSKLMILVAGATLFSSLAFADDVDQETSIFLSDNAEEASFLEEELKDELAALEAELANAPEETSMDSDAKFAFEEELFPEISSSSKPQAEVVGSFSAPVVEKQLEEQPTPLKISQTSSVSPTTVSLQEQEEAIALSEADLSATSTPIDALPKKFDQAVAAAGEFSSPVASTLVVEEPQAFASFNIDFKQVFSGAPVIYSILFTLSIASVFLWLYNMLRMQQTVALSQDLIKNLKGKLHSNQYDEALSYCAQRNHIFCRMMRSALYARKSGGAAMLETMKAEGKRASTGFWQRLSLLNDIAIIAPMLGLLGTVLGMFYAFYDLNRSLESFTTLFDGLGVSVGTTVAGLIVAIIAMVLHAIGRYRLVKTLSHVENEVEACIPLIEPKP